MRFPDLSKTPLHKNDEKITADSVRKRPMLFRFHLYNQ